MYHVGSTLSSQMPTSFPIQTHPPVNTIGVLCGIPFQGLVQQHHLMHIGESFGLAWKPWTSWYPVHPIPSCPSLSSVSGPASRLSWPWLLCCNIPLTYSDFLSLSSPRFRVSCGGILGKADMVLDYWYGRRRIYVNPLGLVCPACDHQFSDIQTPCPQNSGVFSLKSLDSIEHVHHPDPVLSNRRRRLL